MFGKMFMDSSRHNAYVQALRQVVVEGSVVLDIGTGTGIYALLACQLGARRVYALDVNPLISLARELAAANGFADRIEFIEALSSEVTLVERADVIVADLRGTLPFYGQNLPSLDDARRRHLAPGGTLIPRRDEVHAAVVTAPGAEEAIFGPWLRNPLHLDMRAAARMAANTLRSEIVTAEQLLTESHQVAVIDYLQITTPDLHAHWSVPVVRAGTAHGISVWFDASPAEGITYTTGPGAGRTIYGTGFLPLETPVELTLGDHVDISLHAILDEDYVWAWSFTARDEFGSQKVALSQSTLHSVALSRRALQRRSARFVLGDANAVSVDLVALQCLRSGASLGEVANTLLDQFPNRVGSWALALTHAADLAEKYVG